MKPYIPKKGDYIAVTFDPQSGHEQKGRCHALVMSNTLFNQDYQSRKTKFIGKASDEALSILDACIF